MAGPSAGDRRSFPIGRILLVVGLVALTLKTVDVLLVVFLAAIFAWTLATGFAMVQPEGHLANGIVEIYSLTSVASAPSA